MQNTSNNVNRTAIVERLRALKDMEHLEQLQAACAPAGPSLTAALLAGHTQTAVGQTHLSAPHSSFPRISSARLSNSFLDQALLASDPLVAASGAGTGTINSPVVNRLAEENLILKRRLLMRESLDNAMALSADLFPQTPLLGGNPLATRKQGPTAAQIAARSRDALQVLDDRPSSFRSPSATPVVNNSGAEEPQPEAAGTDGAPKASAPSSIAREPQQTDSKKEAQPHPELRIPLNSLSFPLKLYKMLEDAQKSGYDDIISFTPDGTAFKVHDRERFVKEIMPTYFKMSQFASFHRQLNCYGFERINRGTEHSAFYHKLFRRGQRQLLNRLKRKKQRVPGGEGRTLDDDRAAALRALVGIHRNAHVLLGTDRYH